MKHDITHEVSLTAYVYYEFFAGSDIVQFQINGEGRNFSVTFNNATDLRFGGDFKTMCRELQVKEGDFLIITRKSDNLYAITLDRSYSAVRQNYYPYFTGTRRHLIASITNNRLTQQYVR